MICGLMAMLALHIVSLYTDALYNKWEAKVAIEHSEITCLLLTAKCFFRKTCTYFVLLNICWCDSFNTV